MRLPGAPVLGPLPPLAETWRRVFAEFVGTFALVFVAAGTILAVGPEANAGTLEVALASGLVIAVMVSSLGHISGGHFNPAITFGFLVTRRISVLLGLAYWIAQLGAEALSALLRERASTSVPLSSSRQCSPSSSSGSSSPCSPTRAARTRQSRASRSASRSCSTTSWATR